MAKKYISWRRVSTFKQSKSGLGLEAQKEIIRYFIERDNGEWIADYSECYTGKDLNGCVELRKAIEHCKREGAVLIIAKTDRFRSTIEALQIYEEMGDGNIMFCDLPHTDKFTMTLFFALAEREALIVSIRTKQALAEKKKQGACLGASNEKYKAARAKKTREQIEEELTKRGQTRRMRFQESNDVVAFKRICQRVFGDACKGEPKEWDWSQVNTKGENKHRILGMMCDFQAMDKGADGVFARWDFSDIESKALQSRLAAYIATFRNSVMK